MKASLVMAGPDVPRVGDLGVVPMTRIAPPLARWFGVQLLAGRRRPARPEAHGNHPRNRPNDRGLSERRAELQFGHPYRRFRTYNATSSNPLRPIAPAGSATSI
jgi:hypothetical protein